MDYYKLKPIELMFAPSKPYIGLRVNILFCPAHSHHSPTFLWELLFSNPVPTVLGVKCILITQIRLLTFFKLQTNLKLKHTQTNKIQMLNSSYKFYYQSKVSQSEICIFNIYQSSKQTEQHVQWNTSKLNISLIRNYECMQSISDNTIKDFFYTLYLNYCTILYSSYITKSTIPYFKYRVFNHVSLEIGRLTA